MHCMRWIGINCSHHEDTWASIFTVGLDTFSTSSSVNTPIITSCLQHTNCQVSKVLAGGCWQEGVVTPFFFNRHNRTGCRKQLTSLRLSSTPLLVGLQSWWSDNWCVCWIHQISPSSSVISSTYYFFIARDASFVACSKHIWNLARSGVTCAEISSFIIEQKCAFDKTTQTWRRGLTELDITQEIDGFSHATLHTRSSSGV